MVKIEGVLTDVRKGLRFGEPACDAYVVVAGTEVAAPAMYQIALPDDGSALIGSIGKTVSLSCDVRAYKDRLYFNLLGAKK